MTANHPRIADVTKTVYNSEVYEPSDVRCSQFAVITAFLPHFAMSEHDIFVAG